MASWSPPSWRGPFPPALICADLVAVIHYRRHAVWRHLIRLLPWVVLGVVIGGQIMGRIDDEQLRVIIAVIVLAILGLNFWRSRRSDPSMQDIPQKWWFAAAMGILAGTTSMLANAASPIMTIYLLAMGLPKNAFIGTGAWYYLIGNAIKVPFSAQLGLLTMASLALNLAQIPFIIVGAVVGIWVLKRIDDKVFRLAIQLLAAAAAIRLLF